MKKKKLVAILLMMVLCFSFSANAFAYGTIGGANAGKYVRVYTNNATSKTYVRCEVEASVQWDVRMIDKNGKTVWSERNSCHYRTASSSIRDYSVGANVKYIELKLVPNNTNSKIGFPVAAGRITRIVHG